MKWGGKYFPVGFPSSGKSGALRFCKMFWAGYWDCIQLCILFWYIIIFYFLLKIFATGQPSRRRHTANASPFHQALGRQQGGGGKGLLSGAVLHWQVIPGNWGWGWRQDGVGPLLSQSGIVFVHINLFSVILLLHHNALQRVLLHSCCQRIWQFYASIHCCYTSNGVHEANQALVVCMPFTSTHSRQEHGRFANDKTSVRVSDYLSHQLFQPHYFLSRKFCCLWRKYLSPLCYKTNPLSVIVPSAKR